MHRREALESTYRDGATHVVMSPLEFMQRLAALVPRPRLHLIRSTACLRRTPSCARRSCHLQRRLQLDTQPSTRSIRPRA